MAETGVIDVANIPLDSLLKNQGQKKSRNVWGLPSIQFDSETLDGGKVFCMVKTQMSTSDAEMGTNS